MYSKYVGEEKVNNTKWRHWNPFTDIQIYEMKLVLFYSLNIEMHIINLIKQWEKIFKVYNMRCIRGVRNLR